MARKKGSGVIKKLNPGATLWDIKGRLVYGEHAETEAKDIVVDWLNWENQRRRLLSELQRLWKEPLRLETRKLKDALESWFEKADGSWSQPEELAQLTAVPGEFELRAAISGFFERISTCRKNLIERTRRAILERDENFFKEMAAMVAFSKSHSGRVFDPVRTAIVEVAQTQNVKQSAARGEPSSGWGDPMPQTLCLTISELQEYVEWRTRQRVEATHLRTMCKQLGTRPKPDKRGPKPKNSE